MVITCFNFVIAHPIITPNSVIGKFMYTKAMDDGGDRACHICSCHCSLCLLDMASQDHQGDWPAPLLQVKELSLSEVLSLGLQCVCWG